MNITTSTDSGASIHIDKKVLARVSENARQGQLRELDYLRANWMARMSGKFRLSKWRRWTLSELAVEWPSNHRGIKNPDDKSVFLKFHKERLELAGDLYALSQEPGGEVYLSGRSLQLVRRYM